MSERWPEAPRDGDQFVACRRDLGPAARLEAAVRVDGKPWPCRAIDAAPWHPRAGGSQVQALHHRQPPFSADRTEPADHDFVAWRRTTSGWPTSPTSRPTKAGCISPPARYRHSRDRRLVDAGPYPHRVVACRADDGRATAKTSRRGSSATATAGANTRPRHTGKELIAMKANASMSRTACCYDNAPMESFFHTLKVELVHQRRWSTRDPPTAAGSTPLSDTEPAPGRRQLA